jgi:hypothetical protein
VDEKRKRIELETRLAVALCQLQPEKSITCTACAANPTMERRQKNLILLLLFYPEIREPGLVGPPFNSVKIRRWANT